MNCGSISSVYCCYGNIHVCAGMVVHYSYLLYFSLTSITFISLCPKFLCSQSDFNFLRDLFFFTAYILIGKTFYCIFATLIMSIILDCWHPFTHDGFIEEHTESKLLLAHVETVLLLPEEQNVV